MKLIFFLQTIHHLIVKPSWKKFVIKSLIQISLPTKLFCFPRFLVLSIIGGSLCGFSKEDGLIPVNKNLWSLSFILALAGMAFLLLTVMYLLVDVGQVWSGSPMIYVGMNPILVSDLFIKQFFIIGNIFYKLQACNSFESLFYSKCTVYPTSYKSIVIYIGMNPVLVSGL